MIIQIDSTLLRQSSCNFRLYLMIVAQKQAPMLYNDIEYGTAFHKFVATFTQTEGDLAVATREARDYFDSRKMSIRYKKQHLNTTHLLRTCFDYQEFAEKNSDFQVLRDADNKALVEVKFSIPFLSSEGIDILLCGTIDKIGKFKNGCYAIGDYKTTSTWDKDIFLSDFILSSQLYIYVYAFKRMCSMANNSAIQALSTQNVGCFVEGVFLSPNESTEFKRSPIFFPKTEQLQEFEQSLLDISYRIIEMVKQKQVPPPNGILNGSCTSGKYRCNYFNVCASPDKVSQGHILRNQFVDKPWSPLTLGED